jgi:hypothetical protein
MLRVGLALIDDGRRHGGFETDQKKLGSRTAELVEELGVKSYPFNSGGGVAATPLDSSRIILSAPYSETGAVTVTLRVDGVLLDEGGTIEAALAGVDEMGDITPEELEETTRAEERLGASPSFSGERFLRAVAGDPQPEREVQILATELFEDGLLIHYTFDRQSEEPQAPLSREVPRWPPNEVGMRVEDDLGTEYLKDFRGGGGGVQVVHGSCTFSPAVPAEADLLRITTRCGGVDLPLRTADRP